MKKIALWAFVILPGAFGTLFFAYFTWIDYMALRANFANFERVARVGDLRSVMVAEARQNMHRINVFADGTWALMCLLLLGMGICAKYLAESRNR